MPISGSNAGYTMFRGSVESTGYPLHPPVSPSLPLLCVTVCHRISTGLYLLSSRASITLHWNSDIYLPQCRQEIRRLRGSVKGTGPHSIRQFPLHFPSCALPCAIAFQLDSTCYRLDLVALHTESPTSTCPNAGKRVGGCCKMI